MGYIQPDRTAGTVRRAATIALRPARADDYDFALGLYLETIKPYTVAYMAWDEAVEAARFARLWIPANTRIIMRDAVAIGWLAASERADDIFLQQIYIVPAYQGHGIGTEVMQSLLTQWNATGKPIVLGVLKNNPARRLYERLGFAVAGETPMKFMMRREPAVE